VHPVCKCCLNVGWNSTGYRSSERNHCRRIGGRRLGGGVSAAANIAAAQGAAKLILYIKKKIDFLPSANFKLNY